MALRTVREKDSSILSVLLVFRAVLHRHRVVVDRIFEVPILVVSAVNEYVRIQHQNFRKPSSEVSASKIVSCPKLSRYGSGYTCGTSKSSPALAAATTSFTQHLGSEGTKTDTAALLVLRLSSWYCDSPFSLSRESTASLSIVTKQFYCGGGTAFLTRCPSPSSPLPSLHRWPARPQCRRHRGTLLRHRYPPALQKPQWIAIARTQ